MPVGEGKISPGPMTAFFWSDTYTGPVKAHFAQKVNASLNTCPAQDHLSVLDYKQKNWKLNVYPAQHKRPALDPNKHPDLDVPSSRFTCSAVRRASVQFVQISVFSRSVHTESV